MNYGCFDRTKYTIRRELSTRLLTSCLCKATKLSIFLPQTQCYKSRMADPGRDPSVMLDLATSIDPPSIINPSPGSISKFPMAPPPPPAPVQKRDGLAPTSIPGLDPYQSYATSLASGYPELPGVPPPPPEDVQSMYDYGLYGSGKTAVPQFEPYQSPAASPLANSTYTQSPKASPPPPGLVRRMFGHGSGKTSVPQFDSYPTPAASPLANFTYTQSPKASPPPPGLVRRMFGHSSGKTSVPQFDPYPTPAASPLASSTYYTQALKAPLPPPAPVYGMYSPGMTSVPPPDPPSALRPLPGPAHKLPKALPPPPEPIRKMDDVDTTSVPPSDPPSTLRTSPGPAHKLPKASPPPPEPIQKMDGLDMTSVPLPGTYSTPTPPLGSTHQPSKVPMLPPKLARGSHDHFGWEAIGEQPDFYDERGCLHPSHNLVSEKLKNRREDDVVIFDYSLNPDYLKRVDRNAFEGGGLSAGLFSEDDDIFFQVSKDRLKDSKQFDEIINHTRALPLIQSPEPRLGIM